MANQTGHLRIKAENLGRVSEIIKFLHDIEYAYNSIYTFEFLVDILEAEYVRNRQQIRDRYIFLVEHRNEFGYRKDYPFFDPIFYDFLLTELYTNRIDVSNSLINRVNNIDIQKSVLPSDRLQLTKINIQSPGFWEFLGSQNPLQILREYLKDRHERMKDKKYRMRQEELKGELDILEKQEGIIQKRIETLKSIGASEEEIRHSVATLISNPLQKLATHQDSELIEYPEGTA